MKTKQPKLNEIIRNWHLLDVKGKVLGREAGQIAQLLLGKHKGYYVPYQNCGDIVVVINAKFVKTTGSKENQKTYTRYSGYPGGLRTETLKELRIRKPEEIIRHAVAGMLPKNKLRDAWLKQLHIYSGAEHPYGNKFK